MLGWTFANALEVVEGFSGVVSELVGFVNDDEVVLFWALHFVKAAVGDGVAVVEAEEVCGLAPDVFNGRGHDDKGVGAVLGKAVVEEELLRDEDGNDGFAETNHVGEEEAAVLLQ